MRHFLLLLIVFTSSISFSQEDAWVFFKDKPNVQAFYNNPLSELSQRSLDRRTIQEINLDSKDAPIHQSYIDQISSANGISILAKTKWLNAVHVSGSQENISALLTLNFVDHIQYAKHSLNPSAKNNQNDISQRKKSSKWLDTDANFNYGNSAAQIQMLNGHILHQQDFTGAGKIIAIMDAGFPGVNTSSPFQRLRDNGLILGGYDFVNNSTNFYTGFQHGTQVLSNMGGFDANLVGTAPDAYYYLFITEDVNSETPLEESNWIEAAEEADRLGVDVINTSLGYFGYNNPAYSYSYSQMNGKVSVMSRAVDIAFSRGMICVTSAGNSGVSSEPHISVPADATLNVTVGAVNSSKVKAGFSSIGPSADGRIKPDLMAMGVSSVVATQSGGIATNNGTSFASPILAGAIASFWSAFPNKKNTEIVQLVKESADRYFSPDNNYGYGIPNFQLALSIANQSQLEFQIENAKIYPNPVADYITVLMPKNLIQSELEIFNGLGQKIKSEIISVQKQNIFLSNLNSGVYLYKLSNQQSTTKGKLIKQ